MRFDQFDPVAERILHMPALAAFDGLVFILDVVAGTPGFFENVSQVVDNESRVCLARRDKILVDSGRTCTWWATLTARLGLCLNLRWSTRHKQRCGVFQKRFDLTRDPPCHEGARRG